MRFFLDTANLDELRKGAEWGIVDGVTAGAQVGTMPFKTLDSMFNHPLTDKGLDQFLKDYAKAFAEAPVAAR